MVKTVICDFCLKSGVLCSACKEKIKSGEVSPIYVEIAKLLLDEEKKYQPIAKMSLHDAVEVGDTVGLVVGRGDIPYALSRGGKIIRSIGEKLGKDIRVLERGSSERKFLEDLFAPFAILTTNKIWLPDGTTITGAVLKTRAGRIPSKKVEELKAIAEMLRDISLRVEFLG